MRIRNAVVAVALALDLLGLNIRAGERRPVAFETIEQERHSDYVDAQDLVIRDATTWASVWAHLHAELIPGPRLPEVDFTKKMVIVVTLGTQANTGPSVEVTRIDHVSLDVPSGGQTRVYVTEHLGGNRCFGIPEIAWPYAVIVADTSPNVTFRRSAVVGHCH